MKHAWQKSEIIFTRKFIQNLDKCTKSISFSQTRINTMLQLIHIYKVSLTDEHGAKQFIIQKNKISKRCLIQACDSNKELRVKYNPECGDWLLSQQTADYWMLAHPSFKLILWIDGLCLNTSTCWPISAWPHLPYQKPIRTHDTCFDLTWLPAQPITDQGKMGIKDKQ
mgnify:FL=1